MWIQIGQVTLTLDDPTPDTFTCSMAVLSLGNPAVRIQFPFPHQKQNLWQQANVDSVRQEVPYLREILLDFHQPQTSPTTVYEDNLACIAMSENAVRRKYSRHIDISRYFVRKRTPGQGPPVLDYNTVPEL